MYGALLAIGESGAFRAKADQAVQVGLRFEDRHTLAKSGNIYGYPRPYRYASAVLREGLAAVLRFGASRTTATHASCGLQTLVRGDDALPACH